jgi:ribosomal protein L32
MTKGEHARLKAFVDLGVRRGKTCWELLAIWNSNNPLSQTRHVQVKREPRRPPVRLDPVTFDKWEANTTAAAYRTAEQEAAEPRAIRVGRLSKQELDDLERLERRRRDPAPELPACPECGGVMRPHRNGPICPSCGFSEGRRA